MTPEQTALATRRAVRVLDDAFREDPRTAQRADRLGLTVAEYGVVGRAAALGDVDAPVVAACVGYPAPDLDASPWVTARGVATPTELVECYREDWCRFVWPQLVTWYGAARLAVLARRVVDATDVAGAPLLAAWRTVVPPTGRTTEDAALALLLLLEHRYAVKLTAARACGLSALEALSKLDAVAPVVRKRAAWAQALADRIAGPAFGVLDVDERIELVSLLEALRVAASPVPQQPTRFSADAGAYGVAVRVGWARSFSM